MEWIGLFDLIDCGLLQYVQEIKVSYLDIKEDIQKWIEVVEVIFMEWEVQYVQVVKNGDVYKFNFFLIVLMVDGIIRFQQIIDIVIQDKLVMFMKFYVYVGFSFILVGNYSEFLKGYDFLMMEMKQICYVMLFVKKFE